MKKKRVVLQFLWKARGEGCVEGIGLRAANKNSSVRGETNEFVADWVE